MAFDARAIKLLPAGGHLTSAEFSGLRIEATVACRTWTYRYRSPIDGKLKQIKIGHWPETSSHAAIAAWEKLRRARDEGRDVAEEARSAKAKVKQARAEVKASKQSKAYTVALLCDDYWNGHIALHRKQKGQTEVRRMFDTMLGDLSKVPAAEVTRAQAFDLIEAHAKIRPVVAGYLRTELGAAWNYALDAGRIPENTPNWWRLILRGKIKSRGKKIGGEYVGTKKRVLTAAEAGALINWLPNFTPLIVDALTLYFWTCVRGVEILTMEGCEVHQEKGQWWWVIPKEKTKNARLPNATDHRVPLFGRALSTVLRRKDRYGSGYLFPARTRDQRIAPVEQKTVQSSVWYHMPYSTTRSQEQRPRLSVTHWAPHDLRRTSRTFLAALGCPVEASESIVGHMLPGVVGDYNQHGYDAERVDWLRRLDVYLETLARDHVALASS